MHSSGRQRMLTQAFFASAMAPRMRAALPSQSRGVWLRTAAPTRRSFMENSQLLQSYTAADRGSRVTPNLRGRSLGLVTSQAGAWDGEFYCGAVSDLPLSLGPRLRRNGTAFLAHFSGVG